MLVNSKKMIEDAFKYKYCICQFNINNLEWTRFILEECQKNNAPVILGVSEGAARYIGGYRTVVAIVESLISDLDITIPVSLHLDHGSSFDECKKAIDAGFTSIMIDASKYSIEKNCEITKSVVEYAGPEITVEAEVGHVGGEEDGVVADIYYAKVEDCIKIKETGIFMLAPALGSVHGFYKGEPKLNFDRMIEIKEKTNLPLVLHGGSGIYDNLVKKAISCGVAKMNINTDLQVVFANDVRSFLKDNDTVYDPRKIIKSGEKAIKDKIVEKLILTGSFNRA